MTNRLRRYPALGFLAVAALLASLLPSALRVPLSGPTASAELAPVPGKSDNAQGDLAALGQTSTGGLGAGSGLGGGPGGGTGPRADATEIGPGDTPPPPGSGRNPINKRCVGKPPRQTEDPLSPPCVAYFKGDNGGATSKGVTRDEIVVVDHQIATVTTNNCSGGAVYVDYDDGDNPETDPAMAALVRFFNKRFQTYDRRVHMYGARPCAGSAAADLQEIEARYHPFAVIGYGGEQYALEAARLGMFNPQQGPTRATTLRRPPFVISYEPDWDDTVASAAEFLCARLAGRPARFAGDPTLQARTRKFGLLYSNFHADRAGEGIGWFRDRVRDRCGGAAGEIVVAGDVNEPPYSSATVAQFRTEGVTTVVLLPSEVNLAIHADSAKWYPEWFLASGSYIGHNQTTRGLFPPLEARSAFGITSMRRLDAPADQPHRAALRDECAECDGPRLRVLLQTYNDLLMLFWGIQAAGPKLTPANFDKGLHAIPARQSTDPFTPAAYFAPGNYSFVKDWPAVWWDSSGRPPGINSLGCWRLVEDGLRYRAEDWQNRPGDEGIQGQGQPCQGDN